MLQGGGGLSGGVLWLLLLASGIVVLCMFIMSFVERDDEDTD